MTTQSFRCKTHAHIHTTVSEVIKKVFIQGFRTISENQCLLQILKVTMIGRRDIIKAFKDSNRYEHVRLKISVWQSLSERRSQNKKTLKKQEQSTSIVDLLAYVAHTTSAPVLSSPSTSSPQPTAQSPNDALMATMTQIANLLSGFQKQFPPTNNQLRTSSNSKTHATVHDGQIVTEPIPEESSRERRCVDAEAEAFLADVECTAPYDQPQALTTTNMFQANHEDAYDSDVDEGPNAAVAFMANLSSTGATNNTVNEVHSNDNQIFDNVDYQIQEMHQEEHLDSDAETEIDDNTIPYHHIF
ncbi:hypothetical protein Tco_1509996 [Tanacetum coccineum]